MDVWQVLCVFWAFTEIALARKYFSSIKAEILGYEIVVPQVEWISPQPPQTLSVNLNTTAFHYNLQLYLNEGLLSASFLSRFQSSMGHEAVKDHDHCFYHGKVTGEPEWTVVFSTCLGLRGSFGPRGDPKLRYHIEPLHYHMGSPKLTQPHVLYHGSQYNAKNGTCGTKGHLQRSGRHHHVKLVEKQRVRRQGRFPLVEWTLVNDHAQYLYFQRNLTLVVLRAIEIANGVDDIFKVQGVRIVVVDVVTWTVGDPITITKKAGDFLNNFRDYSPNLPQHYDSAMLFTGMRFEGSTIGIAFTATICETPKSAVGLVYDGGEELDRLISTTAHELGHIFGMDHDDTETCLCEGEPSGVCVMNATLGNPAPKTLSSCSVATLRTNIAGDLGRCLDNEPGKTITDPACGNGIQEEGEACDCGSATECIDPCCNATSCQLVAGAECRAGPCCEINCRFKTYGSVCRPLKNDCDIEEYCTGHHSECPGDFFLQDLTSCKSNNSYCYSGVCQTRDGQCQYHFGTNDAIDECYTLLNTRGSESGHCGFDGTQYKPCLERNAFCGQLQCEDGGILQTTAGDHKRTRLPSSSFICKYAYMQSV
ncbi:Disintegrin and metalloproteinase domain-containing protein 33 [Geodia barretti]|uniref:Disintegrin and metalloproteinase domain-containing protein 33 n=1 Tax=Geodia barretti TaxID=519541 RepID=A0AA35TQS4_GEOBA|nr:Disintegrin and metalloproteinase domain-containing protein 33 [Geodia barretti]